MRRDKHLREIFILLNMVIVLSREGRRQGMHTLFLGESKLGANRVSVSGILVKALNAVFP